MGAFFLVHHANPDRRAELVRRSCESLRSQGFEHMHEVPVHLVVAGWTRRGQPQTQALFPAVQNILLACRAVGLGASLTTLHRSFGDEMDAYLGLSPETPSLRR